MDSGSGYPFLFAGALAVYGAPMEERAVATVVVVGAQWGDEAKGKVVDLLAQDAEMVVRYAGGSNAGHTVMVGEELFKLHLVPSGILNPRTTCVISDGVVLDPEVVLRELDELQGRGVSTERLRISQNAHVVMPYHKEIDRLEEERKGAGKIGTTMQGIGPAYEDKARRCGIRIGDLAEPVRLAERIDAALPDKNFLITRLYNGQAIDRDEVLARYRSYGERLAPFAAETARLVHQAVAVGGKVVFEGAQGTMLDIDHGTYPFVTSSHPVAGGACIGTGIGPKAIDTVIGVCKAYTTRVGRGSFPTELRDSIGGRIREKGHEYGTTTGRPRRIGWLDTVALRHSIRVNGLDCLALTLLDVLSGLSALRICTGYRLGRDVLTEAPADEDMYAAVEPIFEELPGWAEEIDTVTRFERLPANAQRYVRRLEELLATPVGLISVGRRREQTILLTGNLWSPVCGSCGPRKNN
jgi:adenylosuccinate synthase